MPQTPNPIASLYKKSNDLSVHPGLGPAMVGVHGVQGATRGAGIGSGLGAAAGAGLGYLGSRLLPGDEEKKKKRNLLAALAGAGVGGIAGARMGATRGGVNNLQEGIDAFYGISQGPNQQRPRPGGRRMPPGGYAAGLMAAPMLSDVVSDALPTKQGSYDMQRFGAQAFVPNMDKRELTEDEQAAVDKGKKRWLPKIFQSYATPMPEMMASPRKQALIAALLGGGLGALAGGILGNNRRPDSLGALINPGAAIGGSLGAAALGLPAYFSRRAENENIEDIMKRGPENGTKRDLLADSAVQADLQRAQLARMGSGSSPLLAYALADKFAMDKQAASNCKVTGSHPKVKTKFDAPGRTRKYVKAEKQGQQSCWKGYKSIGKKKGKNGKMVNDCVKAAALPVAPKASIPKAKAAPPPQMPAAPAPAPTPGQNVLNQLKPEPQRMAMYRPSQHPPVPPMKDQRSPWALDMARQKYQGSMIPNPMQQFVGGN